MAFDLTGATLGHFKLVARIGAGRSATVYRAFAGSTGEQQVAVKVLDPELVQGRGFRDRFEQDIGLVATLGHPHILPVYAHGTVNELTYLAMALAPGGSLRELLQLGRLPPDRVWSIVTAVADALHRAHQAGVIHRDVKPENVLFDAEARPLLSDFGLAPTHLGLAIGTPSCMAPEQAMGLELDRRVDVYALGALLFELLTGTRLREEVGSITDQLLAVVETPVPAASERAPDVPPYVDAVIARALAPVPRDRYATTAELIVDLRRALETRSFMPVAALPPPSSAPVPPLTATAPPTAAPPAVGPVQSQEEFDSQWGQLMQVVENSLSAAIAVDERSAVVAWSAAAERTFGWSREEIRGRLLSTTLIPPRYQEAHELGFERYLQSGDGPVVGTVIEITAMHREGHEFPIELSISPALHWGQRAVIVGFARDIGPEKRLKQVRAAQEAVVQALTGAGSLAEAAIPVLEAVAVNLDWSVAALWLVDGATRSLRCAHFWKAGDVDCTEFEQATRGARLAKEEGVAGRVWATGEALWIENVLEESSEPRILPALRAGLRAAVAVPIEASGEVLGVLELFAAGVRREDEDLMLRLSDIGRRIGRHAGSMSGPRAAEV